MLSAYPVADTEKSTVQPKKCGILEEVNQLERQQIIDALLRTKGNKSRAAELLGMSRSKFYRILNKI